MGKAVRAANDSALRCGWRAVLVILAMLALAGRAGAADSYLFGVVPQFGQRKLYATWKPIVEELGKRTGLRFELVATLSVPEYDRRYGKGAFDFAYVNPYLIVHDEGRQGYLPLVRDGVPLRGIVVVGADSPLRGPADLEGKTVAFPSPNAVGASVLVRMDLARLFRVTIKPLYVKTHSSVYLHVATGQADAGGGVQKTLQEQDAALRSALKVIYTTREFPSHPVAAHPRVPAAHREAVRRALLEMSATPAGRELFARIPMARPVAASVADYAPMQGWGMELFMAPVE